MDEVKVNLVDFSSDNFDKLLVAVKLHVLHSNLVHLVDDACIVRGKHLRAVFPVSFVAVIFFRVVACGDIHAALASKMADGERAFRRWTHVIEQINLDAVG